MLHPLPFYLVVKLGGRTVGDDVDEIPEGFSSDVSKRRCSDTLEPFWDAMWCGERSDESGIGLAPQLSTCVEVR